MKTLIMLGGGVESVPIIQRAEELACETVVVDRNPNAPGRGLADHFIEASCYDGAAAVAALRASGLRFDGVMCAATDAPLACAEIAQAFGLPGLYIEAAKFGQNKLVQKFAMIGCGIKMPQCSSWSFGTIAPAWAGVVKPVDSRGGRGVIRLLGSNMMRQWEFAQAKTQSLSGEVMLEEWLDGPQLSTESIVQDGRVLFTAIGLRNYARLDEFAPYVIEDGFDAPFHPYPQLLAYGTFPNAVDDIIEKSCRALGWYQQGAGIVKGDLVINDGKLCVIELAPRLSGGFFASHGHLLAYGVDFVGEAIKAALGYRCEGVHPYARQFVSQRYVFPAPDDIGKTVKAIAQPTYQANCVTWNIKPGQTIEPVTCHPRRWGQALATGKTPEEARVRAEQAVQHMKASVTLS